MNIRHDFKISFNIQLHVFYLFMFLEELSTKFQLFSKKFDKNLSLLVQFILYLLCLSLVDIRIKTII